MKITNKYGFPDAVVDGIKYVSGMYDKGDSDFSCTELIAPPRVIALKKKHFDEIEIDVSSLVWSVLGTAVHLIVQKGARPGRDISEVRYYHKFGEKVVSAQIDLYTISEHRLSDYKCTKARAFCSGMKPKKEWVAQMNIQALIMKRAYGIEAKRLEIIGLLRDHDHKEADRDSGYPSTELASLNIPIYAEAQVERYIFERIEAHEKAREELPECTREDTWYGIRCQKFCEARNFCEQYQRSKK